MQLGDDLIHRPQVLRRFHGKKYRNKPLRIVKPLGRLGKVLHMGAEILPGAQHEHRIVPPSSRPSWA